MPRRARPCRPEANETQARLRSTARSRSCICEHVPLVVHERGAVAAHGAVDALELLSRRPCSRPAAPPASRVPPRRRVHPPLDDAQHVGVGNGKLDQAAVGAQRGRHEPADEQQRARDAPVAEGAVGLVAAHAALQRGRRQAN